MNNGHRDARKDFLPCVGQHCIEENLCRIQDMYGYEAEETNYIVAPLVMKYEATASCSEAFPDKAFLLVDHEEYECEKQTLSGGLIAYGDSSYKTCPAIVTIDEKKCTATIAVKKALGSVKVALYYTENVVHPMNEKFLPNGSGGGGLPSDLMETVPDEVPLEITFDGDVTGKETAELMGDLRVKVASDIFTVEQLVGSNVSFVRYGIEESISLTGDNVADTASMGVPGAIIISDSEGNNLAMVVYGDTSVLGASLSMGVWFTSREDEYYTKSLSNPNVLIPGGERTQIKTEFLPKHLQFGEKTVSAPLNITFDGDSAGHESVDADGVVLVKVSDTVLSYDQLLGSTLTSILGGEEMTNVLGQEDIVDYSEQGIPAFVVYEYLFCAYGDSSAMGVNLTTGVWTSFVDGDTYMKSLSNPNVNITTSEIKKLDNKFIDAEWMATSGREQFEGEILPEVTWNAPGVGSGDDYAKSGEASNYDLLKKGDLLRVVFDGKPYDMTVREFAASGEIAWRYVGNLGGVYPTMEPAPPNTGESFCVVFCIFGPATTEKVFSCNVVVASKEIARQTHTISIYADSGVVPLPEKFIPDLNQLTMISPSGKKFKVTVDDSGKLTAVEV